MKKLFLLLVAVMLIAGCTSEFTNTTGCSRRTLTLPIAGGATARPRPEDAEMLAEQGWWGKEIPYIPAKKLGCASLSVQRGRLNGRMKFILPFF